MNRSASLLFALALSLATPATAPAQATPPYKRTILVGGAATPRANGTNLLNALARTGGAGPNNRWLLRLEPGIYNLDTSVLLVKNFVDIEGSGRGMTTVQHVQGGTVRISHSSLSATGASTTGIGIQEVGGGVLVVEHTTVEGHAANNQGRSIYSADATVRVAMSRLVGPILNGLNPGDPQSTFTCVGAYNASFAPLNAKCE